MRGSSFSLRLRQWSILLYYTAVNIEICSYKDAVKKMNKQGTDWDAIYLIKGSQYPGLFFFFFFFSLKAHR